MSQPRKAAAAPIAFQGVEDAIHNPANPNHFMVVQKVGKRVRVFLHDAVLADSERALRVVEFNDRVYAPRLYFPLIDITCPLEPLDKVTHCPLKGEAHYYETAGREIGWVYDTFDFADVLTNHLSFWDGEMRIVEGE